MNSSAPEQRAAPEKKVPDMQVSSPYAQSPPGYYVLYQRLPEQPMDYPSNGRRRRCWHLLACTVLFFVALRLLLTKGPSVSSFRTGRHHRHGASHCMNAANWTALAIAPDAYPTASSFPHHAQASFALPVSAPELSFVSVGAAQAGAFDIVQDLDAGSDLAVVDVRVSYRHLNALEDATVCQLHPNEGTWGLGIFTPIWRHPLTAGDDIWFHITLHLPTAASGEPLKLDGLRTDLPRFEHRLPDLAGSAFFEIIDLKTSNTPITVESLAGNCISAHSYNGAIRGTFNTSTSLVLETSNAPITVYANLMNGDQPGRPTRITLVTRNGEINGDVALLSNTSTGTRGSYNVHARSANAPIQLSFPSAPAFSQLTLEARTANAPVYAHLHPAYEGAFDLTTSWFVAPEVRWRPDAEDPAGAGRTHRALFEENRKGHVKGSVAWSPVLDGQPPRNGSVVLRTVNSPMSLEV